MACGEKELPQCMDYLENRLRRLMAAAGHKTEQRESGRYAISYQGLRRGAAKSLLWAGFKDTFLQQFGRWNSPGGPAPYVQESALEPPVASLFAAALRSRCATANWQDPASNTTTAPPQA